LFLNYTLLNENDSLKTKITIQTELMKLLSTQQKDLDVLGNRTLKVVNYSQELEHEVRSIYLRLSLNRTYLFKDLCPFAFAFEFRPTEKKSMEFKKLVLNGKEQMSINGKIFRAVSYFITDIYFQDTITGFKTFYQGTNDISLDNILIPIYLKESEKTKILDYHDEYFSAYLQKKLIDKIDTIEFIVNGWSILEEPLTKKITCVNAESIPWLKSISKELDLYQPTESDPSHAPWSFWRIRVYNRLPKYNIKLSGNSYHLLCKTA